MKNIILFLTFFLSIAYLQAQPISEPYNYPVKRHSATWDSIKTYQDLRKVCQIPAEIVN
jgi:hypothetical protein